MYRYKPIIYKRACCCNYKESISVIRQLLFWKYFIDSKIVRKGIREKFNLVIVRDGSIFTNGDFSLHLSNKKLHEGVKNDQLTSFQVKF